MNVQCCLLIEHDEDWLLMVGEHSETLTKRLSPDELADQISEIVTSTGLKQVHGIIAPASDSCFFALLQPDGDLDIRDRAALIYELEDHLPIDAESFVADFVAVEDAEQRTAIAAVSLELDRWKSIAEALENVGIQIRSIVPGAVLISRAVCEAHKLAGNVELMIVDGSTLDSVLLRDETIVGWKHLGFDETSLRRHRVMDGDENRRVIVVGASENQAQSIGLWFGDAETVAESPAQYAAMAADHWLDNSSTRWFDLRRDALGPSDPLRPIQKQLRWVTIAAIACLLTLAIAGWWRTKRIDNEITQIRDQQQQLFKSTFPGTSVPGALLRRVRSEHVKVLGSRGASSSQIDIPISAPLVLDRLLSALPQDVRFRIKRLHITDGTVDMELQVRSPVDAGALATSMAAAGFEVKPPITTQKDSQTFDSGLEAKWIGKSEPSASASDVSIRVAFRETSG